MTQTTEDAVLLSEADTDGQNETGTPNRTVRRREQFGQKQRRAREAALQVLFEVDLTIHDVDDVQSRQFDQMLLADGFRDFAERLVGRVLAHRETLDALIAEIAPAWPVPQLPRVDLNVLRLALAELLYSTDVPVGAVINEAVELAKRYGSENSGKFVNGALGTVAQRITNGALTRNADA
jgi:N utilization substance protein B